MNNKTLINSAADSLLIDNDYQPVRINTYVKLNALAREWDRRFYNNDPWPSLAVRAVDKNGKGFMRDKYPSDKPAPKPTPQHKTYKPTAEQVQWAKDNAIPAQPFLYGTEHEELKSALWDQWTGTGSKSASQSPAWGYALVNPSYKPKPETDTYVGLEFHQAFQLPSYLSGQRYTPAVPSKEEVSQFLPRGTAEQIFLYGPRFCKTPKKFQLQMAALNKTLTAAFKDPDPSPSQYFDSPMSLNTNETDESGVDWIPTTPSVMEALIAQEVYETRQSKAIKMLTHIKDALGDEKYQMLVMSAEGLTNAEIAAQIGKSTDAVKKALQRIRKQIKEVK